MVKIKLVGAGRFMHKVACPNVIEKNDVVSVEDGLAKTLLNATRRDALNQKHPIFVVVEDEPVVEQEAELENEVDEPTVDTEQKVEAKKPEPKKPATRKKSVRSRT